MNENCDGPAQSVSEKEIHRVCSILETISKQFTPDSDQSNAIRDAAFAFIAVQQNKMLLKSYAKLRDACGGELSDEMKAKLRSLGIEPDELEEV